MELNLNHVIEQVAKDKGIGGEALQETLEQAILQAAKKVFGAEREIEAHFNVDDGVVELFQIIRVSDEITTTFASHYAERISLADMLDPAVARAYAAQATGEKRLVVPAS